MDISDKNITDDSQAVEQSGKCDSAAKSPVADAGVADCRSERRRQQRQARKQMRGFGSVFRTQWRDKKTGLIRYSPRCSIKYYRKGEQIRESTEFIKESDAWKLLKRRHAEMAAGRPVGPDIEKTCFDEPGRDVDQRL
jgi:hypothetical protein